MLTTPVVSLDVAARFAATIERRRLPLGALFTTRGASLLGRQIATIAIPWAIYSSTDSLAQAGLTGACLIFPWLLTSPTGTDFGARIGHKPASIAAGLVGGATIAAISLLDLAGRLPLATMLLVVVLFAVITALGSASRHTLLPEAAGLAGHAADQVGGALQTVAWAAIVVGSLLAGLGITQLGQDATLGIAAVLIAIAAAADTLVVLSATPVSSSGRLRRVIPAAASTQRPTGTPDLP